jgi:hypothetical protein
MALTSTQLHLLQNQAGLEKPPHIASDYKERTQSILFTHFDHLQRTKPRTRYLFSLLGGSLLVAAIALLFSHNLLQPRLRAVRDAELSTLQQDLQTFAIPEESFE